MNMEMEMDFFWDNGMMSCLVYDVCSSFPVQDMGAGTAYQMRE